MGLHFRTATLYILLLGDFVVRYLHRWRSPRGGRSRHGGSHLRGGFVSVKPVTSATLEVKNHMRFLFIIRVRATFYARRISDAVSRSGSMNMMISTTFRV